MKRVSGCLFLVAFSGAAAQTAWNPQRPWKHESAYAGSRVCAACHSAIYRVQEKSRHANSLRPPAEVPELGQSLPYVHQDRSSGVVIGLHPGGRVVAERAGERDTLTLEWAFGSGKKGITPVGRLSAGGLAESRLSWYADGGFGLTTGAAQRELRTLSDHLGRPLSQKEVRECFGCHTTAHAPGQTPPARQEMGVRCERCHGPGAEHVRMAQASALGRDRRILHPGRLDAAAQVQMCGVCHGRAPSDSDVASLRAIERNPNTVRFPSQRLVLSRCYNEALEGLSCTRCHDPHADVPEQNAAHDRVCLGCHAKPRRECPKAATNCASCHMPRQRVMLHSRFADHYIRIVRDSGGRSD